MLITILINIFAFFVFLFVAWKRLKEDYPAENVFTLCFVTALGLLSGYLVARQFAPAFWFWMEILGVLIGFIVIVLKIKLKVYETLEALVIGYLYWFGIYWAYLFIKTPSIITLLAALLAICFIILFYLLNKSYRNFSWYKSGRIGFSGLTTAGFFFLTRGAIASFFPFMLSFSGKSEAVLSGAVSFIIFLLVYNLSRQGE